MQGQCTDLSERLLQQCRAGTSGSKVFALALLGSTLSEDSVGQTPEAIEARRQLWTTDVVAGLLLRSHVEQLCADRPAAQRPLPGQLQAALTSDAVPGVAGMLRLQHNEASFTALYAHFLLWAREAVAGGGRFCLHEHEAASCSRNVLARACQRMQQGSGQVLHVQLHSVLRRYSAHRLQAACAPEQAASQLVPHHTKRPLKQRQRVHQSHDEEPSDCLQPVGSLCHLLT